MERERDLPTGENHGDESMGGDGQGTGHKSSKPTQDAENTFMADSDTNESNRKGPVDTGKDGTQASASQQQGQGAESASRSDDPRNGSRNSGGGQGGKNNTGQSDSGGGNSKGSGGGGGSGAGAGQSS